MSDAAPQSSDEKRAVVYAAIIVLALAAGTVMALHDGDDIGPPERLLWGDYGPKLLKVVQDPTPAKFTAYWAAEQGLAPEIRMHHAQDLATHARAVRWLEDRGSFVFQLQASHEAWARQALVVDADMREFGAIWSILMTGNTNDIVLGVPSHRVLSIEWEHHLVPAVQDWWNTKEGTRAWDSFQNGTAAATTFDIEYPAPMPITYLPHGSGLRPGPLEAQTRAGPWPFTVAWDGHGLVSCDSPCAPRLDVIHTWNGTEPQWGLLLHENELFLRNNEQVPIPEPSVRITEVATGLEIVLTLAEVPAAHIQAIDARPSGSGAYLVAVYANESSTAFLVGGDPGFGWHR